VASDPLQGGSAMAATFRKAAKAGQREHWERGQPRFRRQLGLLEKKRDYKRRADDYHKKENALKALHKKDGVHLIKQPKEEVTQEQLKVMRTQDLKYVEMKRVAEAKKIERMKSELHLLDAQGMQSNKHVFFFDTKKEVQEFDVATHLNTSPELVDRVYNRPTIETLQKETVKGATHPAHLKKLAQQRKHQYSLLKQRIEREKMMFVIAQKIQARKDLLDKTSKVKVKKETVNSPAVYKFKFQRKR
uniref:U3 small nucleolar RNA-associated protein 11 n=2 Tax=Gopherus evgoodei TaxID=1825980 RepID=A0A8C4YU35_9SAUR